MYSSLLVLALAWLPHQQVTTSPHGNDGAEASKFAIKAAIIAGGARHCKFDKDLVEEYISLAHAKIAQLAKDKEENVIAKMDFTNSMVVASIKEPEKGCKDFNHTFLTSMHDLN